MNGLDQMDELDDAPPHSEITLSTATLLGIFFGLVLVCAVFFGFGYSLGRRSIQAAATGDAAGDSANFSSFKPPPGNPAIQAVPRADTTEASTAATRTAAAEAASAQEAEAQPATKPVSDKVAARDASAGTSAQSTPQATESAEARQPAATTGHAAVAPAASAPVAVSPAQPAAPVMVQIAAVSHQEDADVLVKALRKQGHDVVAKADPTDRLIHVQIGPFSNRKEAEAIRQTLLTEGYNAILK